MAVLFIAGLFAFSLFMALQQEGWQAAGSELTWMKRAGMLTGICISRYWYLIMPLVVGACLVLAATAPRRRH